MIELIIHDMLTNDMPGEVSGPVEGRVYAGVLPEGCAYPAVRHTLISSPASERLSDRSQHTTRTSRYQIDVFAQTYLEAATIANAIGNVMDGYSSTHDSINIDLIETTDIRPGYADSAEKHHHIIELTIIWRTLP